MIAELETRPPYQIFVVELDSAMKAFYNSCMAMTNLDYDIFDIADGLVRTLTDFNQIGDELELLLDNYRTQLLRNPGGQRDFEIFEPALRVLHNEFLIKANCGDLYDSNGILQFRFADFRSDNSIVLTHREMAEYKAGENRVFTDHDDMQQIVSRTGQLGKLLGPDDGYSDEVPIQLQDR